MIKKHVFDLFSYVFEQNALGLCSCLGLFGSVVSLSVQSEKTTVTGTVCSARARPVTIKMFFFVSERA